jgi:D-glycero-D-manno-heptose 1,7-bisphosphate phosphatase
VSKRCAFIDRDGVLVKAFAGRPANSVAEMELLPGAAEGVRLLKEAGFLAVCVSNQGGIELGHMTDLTMRAMIRRLDDLLLDAESVQLDATYYCPHYRVPCDCRKPKPGMLLQAARELDIDLANSLMIGDSISDLEAGIAAGCGRVMLVVSDRRQEQTLTRHISPSLRDAAKSILLHDVVTEGIENILADGMAREKGAAD